MTVFPVCMCTHTCTTNMGVYTRVVFELDVACFLGINYILIPQKRQAQFPNSAFPPHMVLFWGRTPAITESPLFRHGYMNLLFLF